MPEVFLSLGSNLGDRVKNLETAFRLLFENAGDAVRSSSLYETEPWGFKHERFFLNQVIRLNSYLSPHKILETIHLIEKSLGREREPGHYSARTIDIDILFYDNLVMDTPGLTIPHPLIGQRLFVLLPLKEIAPRLVHPVGGLSVVEMLEQCDDKSLVRVYNPDLSHG
ncbi:2-amino-4-hydroxy-6-hydroxymethyldihydropteridine diphosphokinase [bacterium]|nr:MAG: 2-amino-4-hydroxy-6-hydroxymethyldihydropteridine diphosphokinase [bacterium]